VSDCQFAKKGAATWSQFVLVNSSFRVAACSKDVENLDYNLLLIVVWMIGKSRNLKLCVDDDISCVTDFVSWNLFDLASNNIFVAWIKTIFFLLNLTLYVMLIKCTSHRDIWRHTGRGTGKNQENVVFAKCSYSSVACVLWSAEDVRFRWESPLCQCCGQCVVSCCNCCCHLCCVKTHDGPDKRK
jgi:hypothetical protein